MLGGIGDFIQHIEHAINEHMLYICTHQSSKSVEDFFSPFGLSIKVVEFDSVDSLQKIPGLAFMEPVKRTLFPSPELFKDCLHKKEKPKEITIGIHPIGSKFSNKFWASSGKPEKYIPVNMMEELCSRFSEYSFLLFGIKEETDQYSHISNASQVLHSNIWESFSYLPICDYFIGVDSAFKTMSAILDIPTFVLVGNYEDKIRDDFFLNPYVEKGVMSLYKFTNLHTESSSAITEIDAYINEY